MAAAAAVILTIVLTSNFLANPGSHPAAASAFSIHFVPPPPGTLSSVAFSPDGRTLAAGATGGPKTGPKTGPQVNGITYLWDVRTKEIGTLSPGGGAEAFSPDGSTLATAGGPGNSTTYLWKVGSRSRIASLSDGHGSRIESVAFSASGRLLAVNDADGTVHLWAIPRNGRVAAGYRPASVSSPGGVPSNAVAFSPRGATLALGGNTGQAYLWNEATGNVTRTLSTPGNSPVTSIAFSPDGRALAAGGTAGMTYVWDLARRGRITLPDPEGSAVESVAFSPDSKWLATGDINGKTYLWHLPSTKPAATLTNPATGSGDQGTAVFSVAFSPSGTTLATTDTNGHAYLWKVP